MKNSKHTARIGLVYASQKDMAARIAYRAEPCAPESAPEGRGQYPECYGCCFDMPQNPGSLCNWAVDLTRDVRCFSDRGEGIIWKKVDLSAPESRVDVKDGTDRWERSV